MGIKFTSGLLIAAMAFSGAACRKQDPDEVKILRWLDHANPVEDAKAALAKGDHRLRGVMGLALTVPGIESMDSRYTLVDYGVKEIDGTTDGLINAEHGRLVLRAREYAEAYNRYIVQAYKPTSRS